MIIQLNEPTFIRQKYKQDPFNKLPTHCQFAQLAIWPLLKGEVHSLYLVMSNFKTVCL